MNARSNIHISPGEPMALLLQALRAGPHESTQLFDRLGQSAPVGEAKRERLIEQLGAGPESIYRITPIGLAVCPNRRDAIKPQAKKVSGSALNKLEMAEAGREVVMTAIENSGKCGTYRGKLVATTGMSFSRIKNAVAKLVEDELVAEYHKQDRNGFLLIAARYAPVGWSGKKLEEGPYISDSAKMARAAAAEAKGERTRAVVCSVLTDEWMTMKQIAERADVGYTTARKAVLLAVENKAAEMLTTIIPTGGSVQSFRRKMK